MEKKNLIVGIDLGNEMTQMSIVNPKTNLVESIVLDGESGDTSIPTVLALTTNKDWVYGREALDCGYNQGGYIVRGLLDGKGPSVTILGTEISKVLLLERYLRKILLLLKREYPENIILKLVITINTLEVALIEQLYEALAKLGILKDRVRIISHAQSYLYFALSQKKELWMNDVALFDLDDAGLMYYQISVDRRNRPMIVGLQCKDFKEVLRYEAVVKKNENIEYMFENIALNAMHKQIISTIYLTGKGFTGEWVRTCLHSLCNGRRVFVGQNLYCYGACYAAREDATGEKFGDFVFFSEETLPVSISMKLYANAKEEERVILPAATAWYEANRTFHVILDREAELQFVVRDMLKKTTQTKILSLDGLESKMERGNRVEIRITCLDNEAIVITVKDMGFGEFNPSTNRVWEQVIKL